MNQKYNSLLFASLAIISLHENVHASQKPPSLKGSKPNAAVGFVLDKRKFAVAAAAGGAKFLNDKRLGKVASVPSVGKYAAAGYGVSLAAHGGWSAYANHNARREKLRQDLLAAELNKLLQGLVLGDGKIDVKQILTKESLRALDEAVQEQQTRLNGLEAVQTERDDEIRSLSRRVKILEEQKE